MFAGGGSTAAAVTLDTVADESRKMTDGVARSPSRLCSRDGKICCYGDPLITIFLLGFVPCFLLFVFRFSFPSHFFPTSRYVYLLRVPSSVQQPSATLEKYVFYITCSFCLCRLYPTHKGMLSVDPSVARNTLRSSTRHLAQLFSGRPGPGFSPPAIVPNITRRGSRSLYVRCAAPAKYCIPRY